jgi:hypothetical protein
MVWGDTQIINNFNFIAHICNNVGSNHYSDWHCIKWSIQHISYDAHEGACNQPKYAAEKTLKIKKKIVSRGLFTIHLQIFQIYFPEHIQKILLFFA